MTYCAYPELFAVIAGGAGYIYFVNYFKKKNKEKLFKILSVAFLFLFTAAVLWLAIIKRIGCEQRALELNPFGSYHRILTLYNSFEVLKEIIDNILVFIPIGIFAASLKKSPYEKNSLVFAVMFGFGVSLFIEIMQYCFSVGFSETGDLLNNTLGSLIGCGIHALSGKISLNKGYAKLKKGWTFCLLPGAVTAVLFFLIICYRETILLRFFT